MTKFHSQLNNICDRPELYVGERRYWLVAIWLSGYAAGLSEGSGAGPSLGDLDGFRDWLSQRFYKSHGIERNLVWLAYIPRVYPADEDALKQLPILFSEFVAERDHSNAGSDLP